MISTAQIPAAPKPSRMKLSGVIKGKIAQPLRTVIYSAEGLGKTTFAADAPAVIFLPVENGTNHLNVQRFPVPETWQDILDAVSELTTADHDYKTLAVDTVDAAESLLWAALCQRHNVPALDDIGGGYGKGFAVALDEWRRFLVALERLQKTKGMNVLLLAHSWIKSFKNPIGPDWDRYELKLNKQAAGLLKEWADDVLYCSLEEFGSKDEKTKRIKGVSSGARVIHTQRCASFDAKNRNSLPEKLPLLWSDYEAAVQAGEVAPVAELRAEILRKAATLGEEFVAKVAATVEKAGNNAQSLALINNRVNAKISEQDQTTNNEGVKQ